MRILFLLFIYLASFSELFANNAIPGPRDCFWARGPISSDPYINIAYPDSNVYYWAAVFSMPEGSTLEIKGDYPYSRYMSFFSYNERGKPIASLTDYQIQSEAVNPFIPGNQRSDFYRSYSIEVLNKDPSINLNETLSKTGNFLFSPEYRKKQQSVVYRVYLPDKNIDITGGVKLPQPVLTLDDGTRLIGKQACTALNSSQPLQVSFDALGIPPNDYRQLTSQPDKPDTWPAHNPPKWFIQLLSLIHI